MAIDALTLGVVVDELAKMLCGGKINKINQPAADTIVFNVYCNRQDFRLVLAADSTQPKLFISDAEYPNPLVPPSFCMHLRKHILHSEILSICMLPEERVVKFALKTNTEFFGNQTRTLVFELMGRYSNIFLLGSDNIISDCLKRIPPDLVEAARNTLPGLPYIEPSLPPEILPDIRGISRVTAQEISARATKNGTSPKTELALLRTQISPVVYLTEGVPTDFCISPYLTLNGEQKHFETMGDALRFFYTATEQQKNYSVKLARLKSVLQKEIAKNQKTAKTLKMRIEDCLNLEQNKIFGDLITSNIYKIKPHDTELVTENFYTDNSPVKISLDKGLSPAQNAQRYYKKYVKQKKTVSMTAEQLAEIEERLAYLQSIEFWLSTSHNIAELAEIESELVEARLLTPPRVRGKQKKQSPNLPAVQSVQHNGFTIFAGKNNIQNEYATFRLASDNDLWLHVKDGAGAHVIIKSGGKEIPDDTLIFAAQLAAQHSSLKSGTKIAVDYCLKKYVKKSRTGIGRVHYTDYHTVIV